MSLYTEPFRWRVLQKIADVIKTVRPLDGFYYDLADDPVTGVRVKTGRKIFGETDEPPFVSILENRERVSMESVRQRDGVTLYLFSLIIQTWADEDEATPTRNVYRLSSEVSSVLAELNTNAPFRDTLPSVYEIKIEPPLVVPSDEFSDIAYSIQRVDLWLAEDLKIPYDDA